jgi:hypothetical protein
MTLPTPTGPSGARIRWEPTGLGGWVGWVGTMERWLFEVGPRDGDPGAWKLTTTFPVTFDWAFIGNDPEQLKERTAEHWLEEFVSALGAVFPGPAGDLSDWQRFQISEARDVLARWDAGHDDSNIYDRERVLADQVRNLLAIIGQALPSGEPAP